jgi:uncharacterized protein YifN (PemK superfamily)
MKELHNKKLFNKCITLYNNILKLKKLQIDDNYCANLLDWFNEVSLKNMAIFKSKQSNINQDQEIYKKDRQKVYWINFGRNVGSEFQDYHYAIVVYELKHTAIVVPLTSKKDYDPKWIRKNKNLLVDLGKIKGYPNECKECYACPFLIQSVSKKRLDRCGNKTDGFFDIKISNEKMLEISKKNIGYCI